MICMSASSDKRDLHLMCQLHFMADRTVAIIPLLPTFERATSILIVPPRVNSSAAQTQCQTISVEKQNTVDCTQHVSSFSSCLE